MPTESPFRTNLYRRKRVLITGGSSGIGRSIAEAFQQHGAHVVILSRDEAKLTKAAGEIGRMGLGGCTYHACDVRDANRLAEIAAYEADKGGIDVLINAAAGNFPVPFQAMSTNAWESVVDIVLNGTAHACQAFSEQLLAGPDRCVINIVAGYAWTGAPGVSHSGAAKAGVLNLTRSLAVEWAKSVRVNAVSPGPIGGTEGMKRLGEDLGLGDAVLRSIPQGRMGTGEDVAGACLYLASPAAAFVTGACLPVDGGQDSLGPLGGIWQALQH